MVSYTSDGEPDPASGTITLSSRDGSVTVTQDVGTLDPGAWRAGSTQQYVRTGFAGTGVSSTTSTTLEERQGQYVQSTQSVDALEAVDGHLGTPTLGVNRNGLEAAGSRARITPGSNTDYQYRRGQHYRPEQIISGLDPLQGKMAAFIPSAYFRQVNGIVLNEDGERIEDARWIVAQDGLPTASPVDDDGTFTIQMLRVAYKNFVLLAESPDEGVDYVWYEYADHEIPSNVEDDVVLYFEEKRPTGGLSVGPGVHFG